MAKFPSLRIPLGIVVSLAMISSSAGITAFAQDPVSKGAPAPTTQTANAFDAALEEQFQQRIQPLLVKYCGDCHQGPNAEADVDIGKYKSLMSVRKQPALWDQIRGVAKIGAMPPNDSPQPTQEEKALLSDWVENALHRADCTIDQPPGHVTIRRLNNTEYDNTIRELFGLEIPVSQKIGFVSDEVGNGFDNQGEVLSLPPLLLEKYLQAGELVANAAIVSDVESLRRQSDEGEALFGEESCFSTFEFAEGEYNVQIRMRYGDDQKDSSKAEIYVDNLLIEELEASPKSSGYDLKHTFTEGKHVIRVVHAAPRAEHSAFEKRLNVERIRIDGPREGKPAYPSSHRRIMKVEPNDQRTVAEAARENFQSFLKRAFRRPPEAIEVERIVSIVEQAHRNGMSFPEAMKFGVQATLVSPEFLYRIEKTSGPEIRKGVRRLDAYDLATRLSYFLWSCPPDDELLRAAEEGDLFDAKKLELQVHRMLDDPRSQGLIQGFFAQWLGLRNLATIEVDSSQFVQWCDRLRDSMRKETEHFCMHLIRREGQLSEVLQADYSFINPRLAEHYGLTFEGVDPKTLYLGNQGRPLRAGDLRRSGVYVDEDRYVRTSLPGTRRGLLTQASILTLTSNPARTSPVKRGKWVLENVLGEPAPPAPPNVPSFEETQKEHKTVSLRKQLEIHRSNPSCASCHKVLDPIGLGLENFNAVGGYRDQDNGQPIEANGELADGRAFSGAAELLEALKSDLPKISRHFARKMLTYALGRGLITPDECAIDEIMKKATADNYAVRTFILAIVTSQPFQYHSLEETQP
ncbi:MAG: DUF1592 domain-containing protein [Pirellulales bacterium]